jgi:hypothetical protein
MTVIMTSLPLPLPLAALAGSVTVWLGGGGRSGEISSLRISLSTSSSLPDPEIVEGCMFDGVTV